MGNPHFWLYDVNSGSHVGHAQWYILYYCHSKKKARKKSWHVQNILPWRHLRSWPLPVTSLTVMAASGDVTSGPITSVTSCHACAMVPFPLKDPPEIWLERTDILLTSTSSRSPSSSPDLMGQVRYCHYVASTVFVRVCNFLHFDLLFWNLMGNWNQTW